MKTNSQFKLFITAELSMTELKSLTLLYQPLVGMDSYALYQTLYHLSRINSDEFIKHHQLFDILNIKRNVFIKQREKLEAVGLLETYQNENDYYYLLKRTF